MKKAAALLMVLTMMLGAMTSCGNEEALSEGAGSSVSDTSENNAGKTEGEDGEEGSESEDGGDTSAVTELSYDDYNDALKKVFNAMADGDAEKSLECSLPGSVTDALKRAGVAQMFAGDGMLEIDEEDKAQIEQLKVVSVRAAEAEEKEMAEKLYSFIEGTYRTMADLGIDFEALSSGEIPEDKMAEYEKAMEKYSDISDIKDADIEKTVEFEMYNMVTFEVEGDEQELPAFKVKGEDIKVDIILYPTISMFMDLGNSLAEDIVETDPVAAANSAAKTVFKVANSAATELDEQDEYLGKIQLVCSDSSKDITESEFDADKFREYMSYYWEPDCDYFFVSVNGVAIYCVADNNGEVGIYPENQILTDYSTSPATFEDLDEALTYDELYEKCAELVRK